MADFATTIDRPPAASILDKKMKKFHAFTSGGVVLAALVFGVGFIAVHMVQDMGGVTVTSIWPFVLLGVALLIALDFEFVNGFHDTANAVATVIYTHSLEPNIAVVWSGLCNLAGVLVSSGAVAFSIITLLPVELILQVSSGAGYSMVFALLIAAIVWNLSTWWLGLPASSSHTMVGSIIGVGLANQLMSVRNGTSGVESRVRSLRACERRQRRMVFPSHAHRAKPSKTESEFSGSMILTQNCWKWNASRHRSGLMRHGSTGG